MTKEEILAMTPSTQMGNLVATEVMEWHREGDHWVTSEGFWVKSEGLDGWYPWRDISAAWLVVERMNKLGFGWIIAVFDPSQFLYPKDMFQVDVHDIRQPADTKVASILADTAPEAICKAALISLAKKGG